MRLHILRHGKTDPNSPTGKDFDRPLLPKGIKQCEAMRAYLEHLNVETIWCSSAVRTTMTADLVVHSNQPKPDVHKELYLASKQDLLKRMWSHKGGGDLLIVGHNFGISDLASYFTDERIELRTSEYVCIEFDYESWMETSVGTGTILDQYRPKVSL